MQVRVITMKYNEGQQGFSEEALRSATFGRDVLACETHFFTHGGAPHLTLVLQLADASGFDGDRPFKPRDPNAPNPEEALPEELRGVYRDLKKWRNDKAKAEGRPAYAIARNAQLAELVAKAPKTKAAIREIEGFGESFVERYGDEVLGMLAQVSATADAKVLGTFLESQLGLSFKQTPYVNRTGRGMDFLGLRVYPQTIEANRASLDRYKRKVRIYDRELEQGYWDEATYQQRMGALSAFLETADTLGWRKEFLRKEEGRRRGGRGRGFAGRRRERGLRR